MVAPMRFAAPVMSATGEFSSSANSVAMSAFAASSIVLLAIFGSLGIGRHYSIVRFFIQRNFLFSITFCSVLLLA